MARRQKKKKESAMLELNMTAMCDVIFLLLIYLILTAGPVTVLAHLDVNRPQPDPNAKAEDKIPDMIEIMVFSDAYVIKGKRVSFNSLRNAVKELASISTTQTILVKCAWDSPHEKLIQALDLLSEFKLTNISVLSM